MNRWKCVLAAAVLALSAGQVHAQATRTWVSGVGDDVNPCSRTAPCKTFAGAISKTATGGEISVLDPGGFGGVTITKSITIDGTHGAGYGAILNSISNGVVINAAGATITLRNLTINGAGNGLVGIKILAAAKVFIENCQISGNVAADPNGRGISDQRTTGGQLLVENTIVRANSQSGIVILPASGSTPIDVTLRGVQSIGNGNAGLAALTGSRVVISNSTFSGNANFGIAIEQPAGLTGVFVSDTVIADNGTGILVGAGTPFVRLSNVLISNNDVGIAPGAGNFYTFNNNKIVGNGGGNGPFSFTAVGSQ